MTVKESPSCCAWLIILTFSSQPKASERASARNNWTDFRRIRILAKCAASCFSQKKPGPATNRGGVKSTASQLVAKIESKTKKMKKKETKNKPTARTRSRVGETVQRLRLRDMIRWRWHGGDECTRREKTYTLTHLKLDESEAGKKKWIATNRKV